MIICIPTAINQTVPQQVLDAIAAQTVPCSVVVIATPGVIDSQRKDSKERLTAEAESRNACTDYLSTMDEDFVMVIDRDIAMNPTTVAFLHDALVMDESLGAVAAPIKDSEPAKSHVVLGCTMWRMSALEHITFPSFSFGCLCLFATQRLKELGLRHAYANIEPVTELEI